MNKFRLVLTVFWEMFKIALFVVGGGYAILAVADRVFSQKLKWTREGELVDELPVLQMVPGLIAGNTAIYVGHKMCGWIGAAAGLVAVALPSFAIFLVLSCHLDLLPLGNPWVDAALMGSRCALTGIIAGTVLKSWRKNVKGVYGIAAVCASTVAIAVFHVNTALVLLVAMLFGVAAVFGGLAGGTGYRHAVNAKLEEIFPRARIRNGSDAENILFAGLGVEDGCGLISGTGSILYARSKGAMHRIGGWGWIFDCAGSGYDLGRDAVLACLREYDGRDGHTLLSDLFAEKFGCGVRQHLDEIYIRGKTYVASFAPLVFEAYRRGDAKAKAIMEKSADALAELITSAARFFDGEYRVTMAGSIMTKEPELCDLVKERAPKNAKLSVLDREPVEGAVEAAKWLLTLDELPPLAEE